MWFSSWRIYQFMCNPGVAHNQLTFHVMLLFKLNWIRFNWSCNLNVEIVVISGSAKKTDAVVRRQYFARSSLSFGVFGNMSSLRKVALKRRRYWTETSVGTWEVRWRKFYLWFILLCCGLHDCKHVFSENMPSKRHDIIEKSTILKSDKDAYILDSKCIFRKLI